MPPPRWRGWNKGNGLTFCSPTWFFPAAFPARTSPKPPYNAGPIYWPDIKVLFVSGYLANIAGPHAATDLGDRLLSKPFTRTALALKLREILEG